ncbi:hypothetical protein BSNK01_12000 [Bacillaceae bacterium]
MSVYLAEILAELKRRKREEAIRYFRPHKKQKEWLLCGKRVAFALGGNRTGKTEAGAVKTVFYALGDSIRPYLEDWPEDLREEFEILINRFDGKPTRGWVFSESFEVQRDVTQKKLLGDPETGKPGLLPLREIADVTYRRKDVIDVITLKNGSIIGFKSYDQGRDKAQGTSMHFIWLDEEAPKDIYAECQMRVLDTKGDIFATMTPLQGLTWVYDDIYLNDQKPPEKQDPEIFVVMMSWEDNPYLSEEEIRRLEASMDPAEIEARKYGRFIMPGKSVLDVGAIMEMMKQIRPGERGFLDWVYPDEEDDDDLSVVWRPDQNGDIEIWNHPHPRKEYLVAADVAEGLEHGDFSVAGVINRHDLSLDAVYHGHCDPDILAEYIHKLCIYYNRAIAVPERNNHGLSTINELKKKYKRIYKEKRVDKMSNEQREVLGWRTDTRTRPLIVDALKTAVRERAFTCYYKRFFDEAQNFIRDKNGKEQAREGYWDDVIIMCAIGIYAHTVLPMGDGGKAILAGEGEGKRKPDFDREIGRDEEEDDIDADVSFF